MINSVSAAIYLCLIPALIAGPALRELRAGESQQGHGLSETANRVIREDAPTQQRYILKPVQIDPRTGLPTPAKAATSIKKREKSNISVLVAKLLAPPPRSNRDESFGFGNGPSDEQATQTEEPVPNTWVRFDLNPSGIGDINPQRIQTDARGIATVSFDAGQSPGRGSIKCTAEDTGDFIWWEITVLQPTPLWRNKWVIGPTAAAVAVGVAVGILVTREKRPITPVPPPIIVP